MKRYGYHRTSTREQHTVLGIDVDDVPVLIIIILWVVFSAIAAVVVDRIGL